MKRAALLLLLPLLSACESRYLIEQKQLRAAQSYGQAVLDAYASRHLGNSLAANATADFSCERVLRRSLPQSIKQCQVWAWGQQAVAEVSYLSNPADELSWQQTRVGQMHGIASDAELNRYGHTVAQEYKTWTEGGDYAAWVKAQPVSRVPSFGFAQECRVFSKLTLPAGIKTCIQGPGAADGPTIMLTLNDGSTRSYAVPLP